MFLLFWNFFYIRLCWFEQSLVAQHEFAGHAISFLLYLHYIGAEVACYSWLIYRLEGQLIVGRSIGPMFLYSVSVHKAFDHE